MYIQTEIHIIETLLKGNFIVIWEAINIVFHKKIMKINQLLTFRHLNPETNVTKSFQIQRRNWTLIVEVSMEFVGNHCKT